MFTIPDRKGRMNWRVHCDRWKAAGTETVHYKSNISNKVGQPKRKEIDDLMRKASRATCTRQNQIESVN